MAVVLPRAIDLRGVARDGAPLEVAAGLRRLHLRRHLHELVGRPERTPGRPVGTDRARRQRRRGDVELGSETREWIVVFERAGWATRAADSAMQSAVPCGWINVVCRTAPRRLRASAAATWRDDLVMIRVAVEVGVCVDVGRTREIEDGVEIGGQHRAP